MGQESSYNISKQLAAEREHETRSGFLAKAALSYIQQKID